MGKPIKEWGVVKFLTKKAPNILGDVASGLLEVATGENPIDVIRERLDKQIDKDSGLSEDDKQIAKELMASDLERERIALEDRKSARLMQQAALKHGGHIARNFVYYIGGGTILMAFSALILLMFFEVPEQNKSIVDMSIGFIFGTGLATILNFFFGSSNDSNGSKDQLREIISRITGP